MPKLSIKELVDQNLVVERIDGTYEIWEPQFEVEELPEGFEVVEHSNYPSLNYIVVKTPEPIDINIRYPHQAEMVNEPLPPLKQKREGAGKSIQPKGNFPDSLANLPCPDRKTFRATVRDAGRGRTYQMVDGKYHFEEPAVTIGYDEEAKQIYVKF